MPTLTGYSNTITADGTYVLACVDPMARKTAAVIALTKQGSYDGTITVQGRPRGSLRAFSDISYAKPPGAPVSSAPITPDAFLEIDGTGMEVALVTTGRTQGSLVVDVALADQD